MIKAITLFRKRPDMTEAACQEYWRTGHGDIVTRSPLVNRYTQSHPLLDVAANNDRTVDGIAEMWFADTNAMREMAATREYADIQKDEAVFIDRPTMQLLITDEHIAKDGPQEGTKVIRLLKRNNALSPSEYQAYLKDVVARNWARDEHFSYGVISLTKLAGYKDGREPAWDAVCIQWFASEEDYADSEAQQQKLTDEEQTEIEEVLMVREYVIRE